MILLILFSSFVGNTIHAATITSIKNGDWNDKDTWVGGVVPGPSDTVIIAGHDVKVTASTSAASVTFSTGDSKLEINNGVTLTVAGAVTLKNASTEDTKAEIKGDGTLLAGSLIIGSPVVTTTSGSKKNELKLKDNLTLKVSGAITLNNDVKSSSINSQPILTIEKANVSATSIVFTHSGVGTIGSSSSVNIKNDDTILTLTAAIPFVVNYDKPLVSSYIDFKIENKTSIIFGCINSAPTSLTNSNAAGTTSNPTIDYKEANITFTFPDDKTVAAAASYTCSGSSTSITVMSSLSTTSYQLRIGTTAVGAPVIGNGGTISLPTGNLTTDTTFNVLATLIASSCPRELTTTPTVSISPLPTATGVTICQGSSGALTATNSCISSPISTGSKHTESEANQDDSGDKEWKKEEEIKADDNDYTTSDLKKSNSSNILSTTNYKFSIPTNATIKGVVVTIGRESKESNSLQDLKVKLQFNGSEIGNNKASSSYWPTSESAASYGSSTDLWGITTFTPAIINDSTFGVFFQAKNGPSKDSKASVDYIQINVTYTIPGTLEWYTTSTGGTAIATGASFNPVGVAGSGLSNTNTAGTTPYYAACSSAPGCRTQVNFIIRSTFTSGTIASSGETICNGGTPTAIANTTVASGGDSSITYSWRSSADSYGTAISGATGATYTPPAGLTTTTSYRRYAKDGSCNVTPTVSSGTWTVTVNDAVTSGAIGTAQTICNGDTPTVLISTTSGTGSGIITYEWQTNASGSYVTIGGATSATYSPPALTTTTSYKRRTVAVSGGTTCYSAYTAPITITVNTPTTPVVGTITQPTCLVPTGSIAFSGLPADSWTINRSGSSTSTPGSGTTTTISGIPAGEYYFSVSSSTCTSAATARITINPLVTTTYNGSSWTSTPDLNKIGVISGSGTISSNVDLCSCTVNGQVNTVVSSGVTLKLQDFLIVNENGTLTFNDSSNLVQINDAAVNSGSISYKRKTTEISNFDYTYWSSPVLGQTLKDLSPNTLADKQFSLNAASNSWTFENRNNTMTVGKGYIMRGPQSHQLPAGPSIYEATFIGTPNNGIVSTAIGGADTGNLIGNPYPSAIDADAFLRENSSVLEGTLYFWTHNTSIQLASLIASGKAGSGIYAYTSDDYATYNLTGLTSTAKTAISGGATPDGTIAAGQGFMAIGKAAGDAIFKNSMRLKSGTGTTLSNSSFFKMATTSKTTESTATSNLEKNRLWLNLSNNEGAFKQTLIGYITGATNKYDSGYDGISFNGNSFIDFYSINENNTLSIQGRALPFQDTDSVPLGYSSKIAGEFTIAIDNVDGSLSNQEVYLEDKLTLTTHNLKQSPYQFTTATGTFNERFVINYKAQNTLGIEDFETVNNEVTISQNENKINISSSSELINEVLVYDISGKLILQNFKVDNKELSIVNLTKTEQVLIIKVKLNNGQVISTKVIH